MQLVQQARNHGVTDATVLNALSIVPRHHFVPQELVNAAFNDSPLPIGHGQTISQPAMVALMAEAANISPDDNVLEIGTGSGYGAAILRCLTSKVVTLERLPPLAEQARLTLQTCKPASSPAKSALQNSKNSILGTVTQSTLTPTDSTLNPATLNPADITFNDITVLEGDGTLGLVDKAPYDAIVVTAAGPAPPPPLVAQLAEGGRLVMPVLTSSPDAHPTQQTHSTQPTQQVQHLIRFTRTTSVNTHADSGSPNATSGQLCEESPILTEEILMPVRFVPLVGAHGVYAI